MRDAVVRVSAPLLTLEEALDWLKTRRVHFRCFGMPYGHRQAVQWADDGRVQLSDAQSSL